MRIKQLDALRGIAALFVTIFHITGSSGLSSSTAMVGSYGWIGVQMFFVISGFILPYSMDKFNYQISDIGKFIIKRVIRIYPVFLVAIFIALTLAYLTNRYTASIPEILSNVFFLNGLTGCQSLSPVFWTLAIEFQFYIFIGFAFPMISKNNNVSIIFLILVSITSFWAPNLVLFRWFPFFAVGILIFNKKNTFLSLDRFLITLIALSFIILFAFNLTHLLTTLFSTIFIMAVKLRKESVLGRYLMKLGTISYSLYLVHWEIGISLVSVSKKLPFLKNMEFILVFIGIVGSLIAAYAMYRMIEKPSLLLNSKIK